MRNVEPCEERRGGPLIWLEAAVVVAIALALTSLPAAGTELGDVSRGRAYAEAVCAPCHAVAAAETMSPRTEATPFSVVARTPGINERALAVFLQTPHAEMPNLAVTGQDRDDLIAYIVSLRGKP